MRTIKFRAFYDGDMWDVLAIHFYSGGLNIELQREYEPGMFNHLTTGADDTVELMQFTGLLDKNGKEIYEGDIVNLKTEDGRDRYLEVIFNEDYAEFEPVFRSTDWRPVLRYIVDSGAMVCGNIYENPELLN